MVPHLPGAEAGLLQHLRERDLLPAHGGARIWLTTMSPAEHGDPSPASQQFRDTTVPRLPQVPRLHPFPESLCQRSDVAREAPAANARRAALEHSRTVGFRRRLSRERWCTLRVASQRIHRHRYPSSPRGVRNGPVLLVFLIYWRLNHLPRTLIGDDPVADHRRGPHHQLPRLPCRPAARAGRQGSRLTRRATA